MKEAIADRIQKLIDELGLSKNQFAKEIGISSSLISQITTKKNAFRVEILQKITCTFPSVNTDWILNGIGEMWKENTHPSEQKNTHMNKSKNNEETENEEDKNKLAFQFFDLLHKVLFPKRETVIQLRKLLYMLKNTKHPWVNKNDFNDKFIVSFLENAFSSDHNELTYNNIEDMKKDIEAFVSLYTDEAFMLSGEVCEAIFSNKDNTEELLLEDLRNKAQNIEKTSKVSK